MKFFIEQIAICPRDPAAAKKLLDEIGAHGVWIEDHVSARGTVHGLPASNAADLSFNYGFGAPLYDGRDTSRLEFEVLSYVRGKNWTQDFPPAVSHLGMHCSEVELNAWRGFFADRGIAVAQEVDTISHSNPAIKDSRRYKYVIFNTRPILGVDLKFIVRRNVGEAV